MRPTREDLARLWVRCVLNRDPTGGPPHLIVAADRGDGSGVRYHLCELLGAAVPLAEACYKGRAGRPSLKRLYDYLRDHPACVW